MPRRWQARSWLYLALFLLPPLVYIVVWRLLPLLYTIYLSFTAWNLVQAAQPVLIGPSNYARLMRDAAFHHALKVTLVFTMVVTAVELVYGLFLAVLMDREFRGHNAVRAILLVPMVVTPVVVGTTWYILYHDTIGPINYLLSLVGLPAVGWLASTRTALLAVAVSDVWQWSPFVFLLLLAGLQTIPGEVYEAARVDGASAWQTFWFLTLPLLRGTIWLAVILRSMDAIRVFDKIFVMTGGGPSDATETVSLVIYKTAFQFFEMGYAAAMVVVVLAILSVLYASYVRMVKV